MWNISVGLILDVVACHFYMLWDLLPWKYTGTEGWALRCSVTAVAGRLEPKNNKQFYDMWVSRVTPMQLRMPLCHTHLLSLTSSRSQCIYTPAPHSSSATLSLFLLLHGRLCKSLFVTGRGSWPAQMKTKFEFQPNNHKILFCFGKSFNLPSDNKMSRYWAQGNHSN